MWWLPRLEAPWSELLDVIVVALLAYGGLVTLRGARAHLALVGMGILGAIYLIAQQLGLVLTASIFQAFFAVFLILLVIIFQAELRQVFERLAVFGLGRERPHVGQRVDEMLVSSLSKLAEARTGALVVLPGQDPIERHVRGGIPLDGRISEPLLMSIFDFHSPGHDGAVVVRGDRIERFALHLPLSGSVAQLRNRGTRHAAALGLSERTDALCLVVSEERGQVSAAHRGQLTELRSPAAISERLRSFAELQDPRASGSEIPTTRRAIRALRRNWREAGVSIVLAMLLWVLVVPGSEIVEREFPVQVKIENLPEDFVLKSVKPASVEATFQGLRRDFFFLDENSLEVRIDALMAQLGRRTFRLSSELVAHPPGLRVVRLSPETLKIAVDVKRSEPDGTAGSE